MASKKTAPATSSIDDLLGQLRSRVAGRKASGEYPEGLEESLNAHFERIVHHRSTSDSRERLRSDIQAIDSHATFTRARMPVESGLPGGELLHRGVNKALARQTQGILEQTQEFADAMRRAVRTMAEVVEEQSGQINGELVGRIESIMERLDSYESVVNAPPLAALGDLQRRVRLLEEAEARRGFRPWFKYEDFEAEVGRSREMLVSNYLETAKLLGQSAPVLDIGCGRGEFLEVLQSLGIEGRGVELDETQAREAQERGFDVVAGDGLEVLADLEDGSLGGIAMIQVAEHLSAQQLMDFAQLSFHKMRPGGRMIIETPNPLSLYVHAYGMFLDPTHDHLVHPIYMRFLFEQAGFAEVAVEWRSPPPDSDVLQPVGGDADSEANRNVERLNRLLFQSQDYMLIITR